MKILANIQLVSFHKESRYHAESSAKFHDPPMHDHEPCSNFVFPHQSRTSGFVFAELIIAHAGYRINRVLQKQRRSYPNNGLLRILQDLLRKIGKQT